MKTKIFILLFAIAATIGSTFASNTSVNGIWYDFDNTNHTATVTYRGDTYSAYADEYAGAYSIPSLVTYNNEEYNVVNIDENAFYDCSSLTSVEIPNSVTKIGNRAFYNCASLSSIIIPNSVVEMGYKVLYGCSALTSPVYNSTIFAALPTSYIGSYTIPNGIRIIAGSAFRECLNLTQVTMPSSMDSIGSGAFYSCTNLNSVTIGENVKSISYQALKNCSSLTVITIPARVESIGDRCFEGCSNMNAIKMLSSIPASLGTDAFMKNNCDIQVPCNDVSTYISAWTQYASRIQPTTTFTITTIVENPSYGSVEIQNETCNGATLSAVPNSGYHFVRWSDGVIVNPRSIELTQDTTFTAEFEGSGCLTASGTCGDNLTWELTCDGTLKIYGSGAMDDYSSSNAPWKSYRNNINKIILPNGLTTISDYAFRYCTYLGAITIPNSVTSIGCRAFEDCSGLTSIEIGSGVISVGERAFDNCTNLTNLEIGSGVISISEKAFDNCIGLTSVICEAQVPPAIGSGKRVFNNCNQLSSIYVPCGSMDAYLSSWSEYANLIKYRPLELEYTITGNVNIAAAGIVTIPSTICDDTIISAVPNSGYHFTQWSDGVTNNPRTILLTQDTTFTAEFAKNTYTISTESSNTAWGLTAGDTTALYLDEVEISAIPNYGYHFVQWNDGNTEKSRKFTITQDTLFTAIFAKNTYSITKVANSTQGSISGVSQAEYLDFVTLTAVPNYGYHFTQWSDGLKDNPRSAQITCDTTFTAEFDYDRVGTCGKDLALVWSYDPAKKVLTIGNAGSFDENMRYGVEAPNEMTELVIGNNVTAVGAGAFAGISTLTKVTIGESVKTLGEQAFYNCTNLATIYNYRPTPTNAYSTAFDGVDKFECTLYVLSSSIDMYKAAAVWRDFYYTYPIGAEEKPIINNEVTVEPSDNTVTLTWPTDDNAASYTIQITKDGVVVCTLVFNANGQLTGIAFAPSRDRQSQPLAAKQVANGLQFTVTGLNSATHYAFSLTAKDSQETVLASYTGEFTTTGVATDIDQITDDQSPVTNKIIKDNQLYILRGDKVYTVDGREVK